MSSNSRRLNPPAVLELRSCYKTATRVSQAQVSSVAKPFQIHHNSLLTSFTLPTLRSPSERQHPQISKMPNLSTCTIERSVKTSDPKALFQAQKLVHTAKERVSLMNTK